MKIGIPLFRVRVERLTEVARAAEELGFESIWLPEHLVFPAEFRSRYPYAADVGDGWYGVGHTPQTAAPKARWLRERRAAAGRRAFEITVGHAARSLAPDEVERYREAEVDRVVVLPWTRGSEAVEALGNLAAGLRR